MSTQLLALDSQIHWTADGSQVLWNFTFSGGYIDKTHVKAYMKSPDVGGVPGTVVSLDVDPANDFIGPYQLLIQPAVPNGYLLVIYRKTPRNLPLVDFMDRAKVDEASLDTVAKQGIFVAAEAFDQLATNVVDFGSIGGGEEYALAAQQSAEDAAGSASAASGFSSTASASATAAGSYATAAAGYSATATTAAGTAASAATASQNSATASFTSASGASTSATAANTSAATAASAVTAAQTASTAASTSASTASTQAGLASTSASSAHTDSVAAASSAGAAGTSATAAGLSETNASTYAGAASSSASSAASSAVTAGSAATAAGTAATLATNAATAAATSSSDASTYATNSGTSATAANTSAVNAASSAANASGDAGAAANSAAAAAGSASTASTQAGNAASSASAANTSYTNAAAQAGAAGSSAASASTYASNASTSESNAAGSASAAATSLTNINAVVAGAASAAVSAEASARVSADNGLNGRLAVAEANYTFKVTTTRTDGQVVLGAIGINSTSSGTVGQSNILLQADTLTFVPSSAPNGTVQPLLDTVTIGGIPTLVINNARFGDIASRNYVAGSTGWYLALNGNFYAQNAYLRGDIEASSLKLANANIVQTLNVAGNAITAPWSNIAAGYIASGTYNIPLGTDPAGTMYDVSFVCSVVNVFSSPCALYVDGTQVATQAIGTSTVSVVLFFAQLEGGINHTITFNSFDTRNNSAGILAFTSKR